MRCIWALLVLVICVHTVSTKKATTTTTEGASVQIVVQQPAAQEESKAEAEASDEEDGDMKMEGYSKASKKDEEEDESDYSEEESADTDAADYGEDYDYANLDNTGTQAQVPASSDMHGLLFHASEQRAASADLKALFSGGDTVTKKDPPTVAPEVDDEPDENDEDEESDEGEEFDEDSDEDSEESDEDDDDEESDEDDDDEESENSSVDDPEDSSVDDSEKSGDKVDIKLTSRRRRRRRGWHGRRGRHRRRGWRRKRRGWSKRRCSGRGRYRSRYRRRCLARLKLKKSSTSAILTTTKRCKGSGWRRRRCLRAPLFVEDTSGLTAAQRIERRRVILKLLRFRAQIHGWSADKERTYQLLLLRDSTGLTRKQRRRRRRLLKWIRRKDAKLDGSDDYSGAGIIVADSGVGTGGLVNVNGGTISALDRGLITADISGFTLAQRQRRRAVLLLLLQRRRKLLGLRANDANEIALENILFASDYGTLTHAQKRRLLLLLAELRRLSIAGGSVGTTSTLGGSTISGSTGLTNSGVVGTTGLTNSGVIGSNGVTNGGVIGSTGLSNTGVVRTTGLNGGVVGSTGLTSGVVGSTGVTNSATGIGSLLTDREKISVSDDVLFTLDVSNLTLEQRRRRGILLLSLLRQRRERLGLSASDVKEVELERLLFTPDTSTLTYAERADVTRLLGELKRTHVGTSSGISTGASGFSDADIRLLTADVSTLTYDQRRRRELLLQKLGSDSSVVRVVSL